MLASCLDLDWFLIVKALDTFNKEKALARAFFGYYILWNLTALIQTSFFSRCSGCGVKRVSPRFPAEAAQCAMAGNLHKNVRDATALLLSRHTEHTDPTPDLGLVTHWHSHTRHHTSLFIQIKNLVLPDFISKEIHSSLGVYHILFMSFRSSNL